MSEQEILLTPWYFIRHAPAIKSKNGLYSDHNVDANLPADNVLLAMAEKLPNNAKWFVSPLQRAKTTAIALSKVLKEKTDRQFINELSEQDFGRWQGLDFDQLWDQIKGFKPHNWSLLSADTRPPEGESFSDVSKRVAKFMENISIIEPERPKVIVSHAGVIRAAVGHVLELPNDQALSIDIEPFSLTSILHQTGKGKGGKWQLKSSNQTFI